MSEGNSMDDLEVDWDMIGLNLVILERVVTTGSLATLTLIIIGAVIFTELSEVS